MHSKGMAVVLGLTLIVALVVPMTEAQSIRNSYEYQQYHAGQTARDFSLGGYYTQPGARYDGYPLSTGYDTPDWGRHQATQNNVNVWGVSNLLLNAGNAVLNWKQYKKLKDIERNQREIMQGQGELYAEQQEARRELGTYARREPPRQAPPLRVGRADEETAAPVPPRRPQQQRVARYTFTNHTGCVVTLSNERLNQEQVIKPLMTLHLPWDPSHTQAFAVIDGRFQQLELQVEDTFVAIAAAGN